MKHIKKFEMIDYKLEGSDFEFISDIFLIEIGDILNLKEESETNFQNNFDSIRESKSANIDPCYYIEMIKNKYTKSINEKYPYPFITILILVPFKEKTIKNSNIEKLIINFENRIKYSYKMYWKEYGFILSNKKKSRDWSYITITINKKDEINKKFESVNLLNITEIDLGEYYRYRESKNIDDFTEKELKEIKSVSKSDIKFGYNEIIVNPTPPRNHNVIFYISKFEDEWFLLKTEKEKPIKKQRWEFYLCDQFDSLISCIENLKIKYSKLYEIH
jgi:hypothetical protein